jgi:protein-tyrosine-phosphatase
MTRARLPCAEEARPNALPSSDSAPISTGWRGELLDLELTIAAAGRATKEGQTMPDAPIRVLFVCTGNSATSQLAEALLGHLGGADFEVDSAGTEPKAVNPFAIEVLAKRGIDWSGATSKSVDRFLDDACDRPGSLVPANPKRHFPLDPPQVHLPCRPMTSRREANRWRTSRRTARRRQRGP